MSWLGPTIVIGWIVIQTAILDILVRRNRKEQS